AKTDKDREKVQREKSPPVGKFAAGFMALARKFPSSPAAVDALFWVATHPVDVRDAGAGLRGEALSILARDHVKSDRVGLLCTLLVFQIDPGTEEFLRGVHERAKRKGIRARSCASLAVNLKHRARLIPALKGSPEAVKQYQQSFGKKAVRLLLEGDPAKLRAEAEKLFEQLREKHGDYRPPTHGTLGDYARRHLLAIRKPVEENRVS